MYQYFAFNIIYSAIVFLSLYLLSTAPFRIRFKVVVFALISWLVPYDLINELLTQSNTVVFSTGISEFNGNIKQAIVTQVNNETFITLLSLIKFLTLLGLIWFIRDVISIMSEQSKLNNIAKFYKEIDTHNIYIIDEDDIYTIGLFNPKIIIGGKYLNSTFTDSIIKHELQHIKNRDQFWLLLITFTQRLLWWNPIVNLLATKARALIELSCDQACNKQSQDNQYQNDLAQILIQTNQKLNPLSSHFFGQSKLNIFRIKQLSKEFKMNKKHKALILSTTLVPLILMLFVSTTSVSSEKINTRVEKQQAERTKNEVDLTIKFNAIEYTKATPSTVSKTNLFEQRSNLKYNAAFDFIQGVNTGGEDRLYRFKATPKRVDDERIIIEFDIKYTSSKGRKITKSPSLMVLNGNLASVVLDGEADEYKFEIEVLPRF